MTLSLNDWQEEIIQALQDGVGMSAWCKGKDRPSRATVIRWMDANPEFEARCARAREWAGELAAEEHKDVIDRCLSGDVKPDVAGRVLSAMQWRAAKLAHRKYGDKLDLNHAGAIKSERELSEADAALIALALEHKLNGGKDGENTD